METGVNVRVRGSRNMYTGENFAGRPLSIRCPMPGSSSYCPTDEPPEPPDVVVSEFVMPRRPLT